VLLDELDGLIAQGVRYVYFIDEIFLPDRPLLEALVDRPVSFGVQMRIDNWSRETLDLLGKAGCVSIEAGVESITKEGRSLLAKHCKLSTEQLSDLLIHAKKSVPFVQANLIQSQTDDPADVTAFRERLRQHGVWANEPVPMFPYPGSPDYTMRWGRPDDQAWERSVEHYLGQFDHFSDIQESRPLPLSELEAAAPGHG
jgi:B12-binding domain/radical SAM domain protein of rhizo-twelve system